MATSLGDSSRQEKFLRLMGAKGKEAVPLREGKADQAGDQVRTFYPSSSHKSFLFC